MCNAWNHSASCICGFGGDTSYFQDHSALNLRNAAEFNIEQHNDGNCWANYSSIVGTKSKCPYCQGLVYFIRHNGGCVWLDELGWPWPKHHCFYEQAEYLDEKQRLIEFDRNLFGNEFHLCCAVETFKTFKEKPDVGFLRGVRLFNIQTREEFLVALICKEMTQVEIGQLFLIRQTDRLAYNLENKYLVDFVYFRSPTG